MNLISITAFQDNYIWVLSENNGRCIIVDPGGVWAKYNEEIGKLLGGYIKTL